MANKKPKVTELDYDIITKVAVWKARSGRPQYELAECLNISPSFLSQILKGRRPGYEYVEQIDRLTKESA